MRSLLLPAFKRAFLLGLHRIVPSDPWVPRDPIEEELRVSGRFYSALSGPKRISPLFSEGPFVALLAPGMPLFTSAAGGPSDALLTPLRARFTDRAKACHSTEAYRDYATDV